MNRRDFLKSLACGSLAASAVAAGCSSPNASSAEGFSVGDVPSDKMSYRSNLLDDKVSLLGFGCMRLPTVMGTSARDEDNPELDQERINQMVDYAIAHGVNLFDTAPVYCKGLSEHAVGIALSHHQRHEFFISTKLSNFNPSSWSLEAGVAMFENSLAELHVDYLDYLMLHCVGLSGTDEQGSPLSPMQLFNRRFVDNGLLDYLVQQRDGGRIRNLGFSYHGDVKVFDHLLSLHPKIHWGHVLIQHNYLNWNHAADVSGGDANSEYLCAQLEKLNIPIFVMEPLLGGRLANLPNFAVKQFKTVNPSGSIASWAFRFAASQPRILTVLSGMTYLEHLQDNIRTFSPFRPLSHDEQAMLLSFADKYVKLPYVPCTACGYCMPCPYGVDIPGNFTHFNKCLNDDNIVSDDSDVAAYRKARRAFLVGYDRTVEPLRRADHCIGCGKCVSKCPQSIDIPTQLRAIESYSRSLSDNIV